MNFKKIQEDDAQVLDKISLELKNQLLKEYNRKIINKIDVLKQKFSSETLDELSLTLQEEYYFPNQIISDFNDPNKTSIIYIIQGEVEHLFNKKRNKYIKNLNLQFSGQVFGVENFFTGMSDEVCTKSREFTKIIKIERQKFIEIIKDKDKDFQVFCQSKDKMLFYSTYKDFKNKCICNQISHSIKDCQYLHQNKKYALQKICYGLTLQQKRETFHRHKFKKFKTILNTNNIQRIAGQYLHNLKVQGNMKSTLMNMYFKESNSSLDSENNSNFYQSQQQISENKSFKSKRESMKNISRAEIERALSVDGYRKNIRQQFGNQEFEDYNIDNEYLRGSSKELEFNPRSSSKLQSELKLSRKENIESSKNIKKDFPEFQAHSHSEYVDKKFNTSIGTNREYQDDMEEHIKKGRQKSKESSFKLQLIHPPRSFEDFKNVLKQYSKSNFISVNTSNIDNHEVFTKKYSTILYTKNMLDDDYEFQLYNPWNFEQMKDFKYYFPSGNSYNVLKRYLRKRRKTRQPTKRLKTKIY